MAPRCLGRGYNWSGWAPGGMGGGVKGDNDPPVGTAYTLITMLSMASQQLLDIFAGLEHRNTPVPEYLEVFLIENETGGFRFCIIFGGGGGAPASVCVPFP